MGGGGTAEENALSTSIAAGGRARAPPAGPVSRTRKRRAPKGETTASCSAPPAFRLAREVSPRRAAVSAENRLAPDAPDFGSRPVRPMAAFQAALAACTRPSGAAMAAGSLNAATSSAPAGSRSPGASADPRRASSPRQATPNRPISSIRPARVAGPALTAGAAANTTASRKNTTARAVSVSNRPRFAGDGADLRICGSAMVSESASFPAPDGPRTLASGESIPDILSQGASGYSAPDR